VISRLKRVDGHAKGVQKMIEQDRDRIDVMSQLASSRAAFNALCCEMLEVFALSCLPRPDKLGSQEQAFGQSMRAIVRKDR
jgi:DNA-binding FrmR family transcriptional regulator